MWTDYTVTPTKRNTYAEKQRRHHVPGATDSPDGRIRPHLHVVWQVSPAVNSRPISLRVVRSKDFAPCSASSTRCRPQGCGDAIRVCYYYTRSVVTFHAQRKKKAASTNVPIDAVLVSAPCARWRTSTRPPLDRCQEPSAPRPDQQVLRPCLPFSTK